MGNYYSIEEVDACEKSKRQKFLVTEQIKASKNIKLKNIKETQKKRPLFIKLRERRKKKQSDFTS